MTTNRSDDRHLSRRTVLAGAAVASTPWIGAAALREAPVPGQGAPAAAGGGLQRLAMADPLHVGIRGATMLRNAAAGSIITGAPPGVTVDSATRTIRGTPAARSWLMTETLNGVSRDSLMFAPETKPRRMKLGMGMAGLARYYVNNSWIDHLKAAEIGTAPATADANGMPQTLGVDGNGNPAVAYLVPMPDGTGAPVRMRVISDGDMDLKMAVFAPDGRSYSRPFRKQGDDWVLTHDAPAASATTTCYFQITAIRRPPTRIALVRDDEAALFRAGRVFRPTLVEALSGFAWVRFMNWAMSNSAAAPTTPDDYITFIGGVPLKWQVQLCREAGIGGWFNLHARITDDEWRAVWPLLDGLRAQGIPVHVEYSNEVWNLGFPQWKHARDRGIAAGYTGNEYTASVWYSGYRSAQLAKLARGKGYRWIVGCQPVNQSQAPEVFAGIAAAGGSVGDFWGWSTTNYASGTLTSKPSDIAPAQDDRQRRWVATGNYDAAFDNILNHVDRVSYSVARVRDFLAEAVAVARANRLAPVAYEGNILHLNRLPELADRPDYDAFFMGMANHELARPAMTVNLETSEDAGLEGTTLFDFDSQPADSSFGVFGLYGRPAFAALTEWLAGGAAVARVGPPAA